MKRYWIEYRTSGQTRYYTSHCASLYLFLFCLAIFSANFVQSALTVMRTESFDTLDSPSFCDSRRFDVVEGTSGIVYSHQPYFPASIYRPGRDCFMTLKVPPGYLLELVALEFQVDERYASSSRRCAGDSLHIFDQDKPDTLPKRTRSNPGQDDHSLSMILNSNRSVASPIKANLCGRIKNNTVIARSTMNVITLWWHSEPVVKSSSSVSRKGFKLQWNAFRERKAGDCNEEDEFACEDQNTCIPVDLACDNVPHCGDRSDLMPSRQRAAGCENVSIDSLSSTSKFTIGSLAGICIGSILLLVLALILLSVCRKRRRLSRGQHKYNHAPTAVNATVRPSIGRQGAVSVSTNTSNSDSSRYDQSNVLMNPPPPTHNMQHQLIGPAYPGYSMDNKGHRSIPVNGAQYQTKLLYHNPHHHYVQPPTAPPPSMVGQRVD